MGIVEEKWRSEQCRVEDGIFFVSDEYVPLEGAPESGYSNKARESIEKLISSTPKAWTHILTTVQCEDKSQAIKIQAGETSWEGEGFLALSDVAAQRLIWLVHFSNSEAFVSVEVKGRVICAVSSGYPVRFEWNIPIDSPEKFIVKVRRAS